MTTAQTVINLLTAD